MSGLRIVRDLRPSVRKRVYESAVRRLNDGARELLQIANQTVPVEEHTLEESGDVIEATMEHPVATVGYGGEASAYAARQHEETTWRHDPGRRSKWLEMAAKESGRRIMQHVGREMRKDLS